MALNFSDFRIEETVTHAKLIMSSDLELGQVVSPFETMVEYKTHFQNWYGEHSPEYALICAMVNLLRMIKTFINTSTSKDDGGKLPSNLSFRTWLGQWPLRHALTLKLQESIENPKSITGA